MKQSAHLIISGRVQGVFYRQTTKEKARKYGLNGWVRNLPDGRVEVQVEGRKEDVEKLIQWSRQGSSMSQVEEVKVEISQPDGLKGFEIKY